MNQDQLAKSKKETHTAFREEIPGHLAGIQHLATNVYYSGDDETSALSCHAELRLEELDLAVRLQKRIPAADYPLFTGLRMVLRESLLEKMEDELQLAEAQFSSLQLICLDGRQPAHPSLFPRPADPGSEYTPTRSPGQPSKTGYLNGLFQRPDPTLPARNGSLPLSSDRNAGGYLPGLTHRPAGGYLPKKADRSAPSETRPAAGLSPIPGYHGDTSLPSFDTAAVRTNYTAIEQYANRVLLLREAIRGLLHLQDQQQ
jgi:hypothetical protein